MSDKIVLIYTLFGSGEEARRVAMVLLNEKLIACANHFAPAVSQYVWPDENGKPDVREEQEFPVLLKTSQTLAQEAMERLKELHSFDTPAILSWQVWRTDPLFANWLGQQLKK